MSLTFPIDVKLKDGSPIQLVPAGKQDIELLRSLYRILVEEGMSYPHDRFLDEDAFMDYWFRGKSDRHESRSGDLASTGGPVTELLSIAALIERSIQANMVGQRIAFALEFLAPVSV